MTFDEMAAQRDLLYAATKPQGESFVRALAADNEMVLCQRAGGLSGLATIFCKERDAWLLKLAVRALRNETL